MEPSVLVENPWTRPGSAASAGIRSTPLGARLASPRLASPRLASSRSIDKGCVPATVGATEVTRDLFDLFTEAGDGARRRYQLVDRGDRPAAVGRRSQLALEAFLREQLAGSSRGGFIVEYDEPAHGVRQLQPGTTNPQFLELLEVGRVGWAQALGRWLAATE